MFEDLSLETIIAVSTSLLAFLAMLNDKIRGFVLSKLNFSKSKAELKKDANAANESVMDSMLNRINTLSIEFLRLSELNTQTQKENFDLKSRLSALEFQHKQIRLRISNKCLNQCIDEDV